MKNQAERNPNAPAKEGSQDKRMYREALTPITGATITSEWNVANTEYWLNSYKAITRCNTILS
ncbi:MAG: hypothetical protein PHS04_05975, partial [Tissierellia bacterium]|nr:hypothetical protein [Tissierellia bacterium]